MNNFYEKALASSENNFGELLRATGPMAKVNPFRFSTKFHDDETDLVYYGYRYYNAGTGRWIGRDPVLEHATELLISKANPLRFPIPSWKASTADLDYTTCGNNCADRIDLLGMCDQYCGKDILGGLFTTYLDVQKRFNNLSYWKKAANSEPWATMARDPYLGGLNPVLLHRGATGWMIDGLTVYWSTTCGSDGCGTLPKCKGTVRLEGGCYYGWDVNYLAFGWIFGLCNLPKQLMTTELVAWNLLKPWDDPIPKYDFAEAGFAGYPSSGPPPKAPPKYNSCHACGKKIDGDLFSEWPHANWNWVY